jgi:tRNA(fMet)-specific endonuclease VapC
MLDTDTCIALIKKHPGALKKLRGKSIGQVGLSAITLGELAFGADKSSRPKDAHEGLREFLLALEIAAFDDQSALRYGEVRASLARRGTPIGPLDTLIGSHAHALDVILVTHNTHEFAQIEGLRLEDWTQNYGDLTRSPTDASVRRR